MAGPAMTRPMSICFPTLIFISREKCKNAAQFCRYRILFSPRYSRGKKVSTRASLFFICLHQIDFMDRSFWSQFAGLPDHHFTRTEIFKGKSKKRLPAFSVFKNKFSQHPSLSWLPLLLTGWHALAPPSPAENVTCQTRKQ